MTMSSEKIVRCRRVLELLKRIRSETGDPHRGGSIERMAMNAIRSALEQPGTSQHEPKGTINNSSSDL
jgi:hypothetical protein